MKNKFIIWLIANLCVFIAITVLSWLCWDAPVHWQSNDAAQTPIQWWWDFYWKWLAATNAVLLIILLIDSADRSISKSS